MAFILNIETDNDAFTEDASWEIARILRKLADDITDEHYPENGGRVLDFNGNAVGTWKFTR